MPRYRKSSEGVLPVKHRILSYDMLPQELSGPEPDKPDYRYAAMRRALHRAMQQELTPKQRICLEKRMAGEKVKDIADELGVSSPTVTQHLHRGADRLKHALQYSCFYPES
jgi:RNA polymerase sigma factor (sigma-70 family)